MAPDNPSTVALLSHTEQERIWREYGRQPLPGDTFIADADIDKITESGLYVVAGGEMRKAAIGARVIPRVVISAEVAHAVTVGYRELRRRKQRRARASRMRNRR